MHRRAIPILLGFLVAGAAALPAVSAWAQSDSAQPAVVRGNPAPIGKIVSVTGSVTIDHVNVPVLQASLGQPAKVKVDDPVYLGDVVQTGADGKIGITFTDGTAFNLSSNARMVLNEFVYDPKGQSNSTLFSLTKGTFTFVAGQVAKTGDMKIDTPVATMGIRGTTPHVSISEDGSVKFSTLIEEGKNKVKVQDKPAAPARRQASSTVPTDTASDRQQARKPESRPNLTICRGC
jgi:hypothetical protein